MNAFWLLLKIPHICLPIYSLWIYVWTLKNNTCLQLADFLANVRKKYNHFLANCPVNVTRIETASMHTAIICTEQSTQFLSMQYIFSVHKIYGFLKSSLSLTVTKLSIYLEHTINVRDSKSPAEVWDWPEKCIKYQEHD